MKSRLVYQPHTFKIRILVQSRPTTFRLIIRAEPITTTRFNSLTGTSRIKIAQLASRIGCKQSIGRIKFYFSICIVDDFYFKDSEDEWYIAQISV